MTVAKIILLAMASLAIVACKPRLNPDEQGSSLLDERCLRCHPLGVSTMGRTAAEWDAVVTRMIGKGSNLNPQEKAVLVDYLARTYKK